MARLKGDGSLAPLLLMSHLDVVPVEEDKWTHPPFAAEIHDQVLWGRGSLDCKNSAALWMTIMVLIKRAGLIPKRDVIFLATADEEAGHKDGMEWMVANHWDLIEAEAALNEGGGFGLSMMNRTFYTCQNAEKGNIWLRVLAHGTPGHGSTPRSDNPTVKIAALIDRLVSRKFPFKVTHTVRQMVRTMARTQRPPIRWLFQLLLNPLLFDTLISKALPNETEAAGFRAMLRNTLCPTVLKAGYKTNVIPSEACCEIDFRLLPGFTVEACLEDLKHLIGDGFEVEVFDARPPSESPVDHPLARAAARAIADYDPDAHLVPLLLPGVTDACFLRPRGVSVYGFTPVLPMDDMDLTHGHDERISLASLDFSLRIGLDVVLDYIEASEPA